MNEQSVGKGVPGIVTLGANPMADQRYPCGMKKFRNRPVRTNASCLLVMDWYIAKDDIVKNCRQWQDL